MTLRTPGWLAVGIWLLFHIPHLPTSTHGDNCPVYQAWLLQRPLGALHCPAPTSFLVQSPKF